MNFFRKKDKKKLAEPKSSIISFLRDHDFPVPKTKTDKTTKNIKPKKLSDHISGIDNSTCPRRKNPEFSMETADTASKDSILKDDTDSVQSESKIKQPIPSKDKTVQPTMRDDAKTVLPVTKEDAGTEQPITKDDVKTDLPVTRKDPVTEQQKKRSDDKTVSPATREDAGIVQTITKDEAKTVSPTIKKDTETVQSQMSDAKPSQPKTKIYDRPVVPTMDTGDFSPTKTSPKTELTTISPKIQTLRTRKSPKEYSPTLSSSTIIPESEYTATISRFGPSIDNYEEEAMEKLWIKSMIPKKLLFPNKYPAYLKEPPLIHYEETNTSIKRREFTEERMRFFIVEKPWLRTLKKIKSFGEPKLNKATEIRSKYIKKELIIPSYYSQHFDTFKKPPFILSGKLRLRVRRT